HLLGLDRQRLIAFEQVETMDEPEIPGAVGKRTLVIEPSLTNPKWAHFRCPCGCGAVRSVDLMRSHDPHWTLIHERDGSLSLHPSVWVVGECESHFFLRHNQIEWVP